MSLRARLGRLEQARGPIADPVEVEVWRWREADGLYYRGAEALTLADMVPVVQSRLQDGIQVTAEEFDEVKNDELTE